jgi:hypothetical protein
MATSDTTQVSDSPVVITTREDTIIGQPQARSSAPHDGATRVSEVVVVTDRHILDPNDPLAVQVPENSGASTYSHESLLGEALKRGTAEEQFAEAAKTSGKKS